MLAFLAFLISLAATVFDFIVFTIVKNEVNNKLEGAKAGYGVAIWLTAAATGVLFLGSFFVCFGCCAGRRERSRYGRV